MELTGFLEALRSRLVPGCDPDTVNRVFAVASAGFGGARRHDGRRVSWLTPSGVPFEASVVGGGGQPDVALRYVTETGTTVPFFAARLAAQRAALDELVGWLPPAAGSAAAALPRFIDILFPDPAGVPARTLFATSLGVVHRPDEPQHLARLKIYGNLGAESGSVDRLAAVWPQYGEMAAEFEPGPDVRNHFAALETAAAGKQCCKLYVGCRRMNAVHIRKLAARFGLDPELEDIPDSAWTRPFTVCCSDADAVPIALHLSIKALEPDPDRRDAYVRRLAEKHHGTTEAVDALAAAAAEADPDQPWRHTVVGFGYAPTGQVARLSLYFAPG